jgi:hypothetical protein
MGLRTFASRLRFDNNARSNIEVSLGSGRWNI